MEEDQILKYLQRPWMVSLIDHHQVIVEESTSDVHYCAFSLSYVRIVRKLAQVQGLAVGDRLWRGAGHQSQLNSGVDISLWNSKLAVQCPKTTGSTAMQLSFSLRHILNLTLFLWFGFFVLCFLVKLFVREGVFEKTSEVL